MVKSYTSWFAFFSAVLPQIFFNLTTLFSYPVFFSLFHAPLDRLKYFLPQFSPFVAQIKNSSSDLDFFLLTVFAKNLTGCFSHCCVEGGDRCIYVSSLLMMVRGANFPPIIAWKVPARWELSAFRGQTRVLCVLDC